MIDVEISKIGIIVIQSLRKKDQETGEEVYNAFIKDKTSDIAEFISDFKKVDNKEEFLDYLRELNATYEQGTILTLHLETHGSEDGISLSSGELVSWKEFYDAIRPLNVKMNNLLVVVMAMCYGAALMCYIEPEERAPFLCFVGSTREESEHNISRGFKVFYSLYTSALDIATALPLLQTETQDEEGKSHFWCLKASDIFDAVMNPDRDPEAFSQMASDIFVKERMRGRDCTKEEILAEMRNRLIQDAQKYRDYYTFSDLMNDK